MTAFDKRFLGRFLSDIAEKVGYVVPNSRRIFVIADCEFGIVTGLATAEQETLAESNEYITENIPAYLELLAKRLRQGPNEQFQRGYSEKGGH